MNCQVCRRRYLSLQSPFIIDDDDAELLLFTIPSAFPSFIIILLIVSLSIIFDPVKDVIY